MAVRTTVDVVSSDITDHTVGRSRAAKPLSRLDVEWSRGTKEANDPPASDYREGLRSG